MRERRKGQGLLYEGDGRDGGCSARETTTVGGGCCARETKGRGVCCEREERGGCVVRERAGGVEACKILENGLQNN